MTPLSHTSGVHRCGVNREDSGYYVVCSCGHRERFHSLLAARREAKAHRRYPAGNPRIAALQKASNDDAA